MKCPNCNVMIHVQLGSTHIIDAKSAGKAPKDVRWTTLSASCPNCHQAIIFLRECQIDFDGYGHPFERGTADTFLAWPKSGGRPCPPHVPKELKKDFEEAVCVLSLSPQASAALTRRSLQQVLREYGKTKSKDLYDQIQEIIDANQLPASLADQLNAVRVIGNFAAHPLKSQSSGLILPVEDHEAEWNLDVLESVFDHYFVKPAQAQARKTALNKKLAEAGKPQLP